MKFTIVFLLSSTYILKAYSENVELFIPSQNLPKFIVGKIFFSAALDTFVVATHFQHFNMTDRKLMNLVKKLNLGYLRIGGNMADRLYFSNKLTKEKDSIIFFNYSCIYEELENCVQDFPNFTMSGLEWVDINNFAKNVGAKILFDLNCLIRNQDGSWNSKNAEELISFSAENNFEIDWQLGNEPNAFKHVFNYEVNATQLAKDFAKLRDILNKYCLYKDALVIGPDVTRPRPTHQGSIKYLKEFLKGIEDKKILNAVAFHQYYLNGHIATINDFLNPETFDLLSEQIKIVNTIVENSKQKNTSIWLTETSSAFGGGAPGLSNTFVGTFLWLDKLGIAARNGIKTVIRQSIFNNYYALIDNNYNPAPDWWSSIFYKELVGPEVLECNFKGPATLRLYCHCGLKRKSYITVFGINISNSTVKLNIQGRSDESNDLSYAYILTSDDSILSTDVVANKKYLLKLSQEGEIPNIPPQIINKNENLPIPPYSLVFWLLPYNIEACVTPSVSFL